MFKKLLLGGILLLLTGFLLSIAAEEWPRISKEMQKLEREPFIADRDDGFSLDSRGELSAPPQLNSILIDSARNGYGWYIGDQRSGDFATDLFGNDWAGWAYRKFVPGDPNTGIVGVAELDVTAGFAYDNFAFWDYVNNMANFGLGARYPLFVATPEGPIPVWNQYLAAGTPSVSDAFLSFDFFGWGQNGGGFVPPESWSQNSDPNEIHSLWKGQADIVKAASGTYHLAGIWELDLNTDEYSFIHGESSDLQSWSWEEATVDWSAAQYNMNSPRFSYGSNGFGAWVSSGYFVGSGDEDYKIMVCTTDDYGLSWGQVQRFEWADLGFQTQITAQDSIYVPDSLGGPDPVLYEGPAHVGITYDFDAIVLPNNEIHLGATITWGPEASATTYYPNGLWMGFYDIHSSDMGQTWTISRVGWNSGLLVGDTTGSYVTTNQIDVSYDEAGNVYMAWEDRDPHDVVASPYPRSNTNITDHYNLDLWAAMSADGGNNWVGPLRITDDQSTCKYGMKATMRTKAGLNKLYLGYMIADYSRPLAPPIEIQADHVQWYYVAEADFTPLTISENSANLPEGIYLAQNYPNPFNPETNISFTLNRPGLVSLKIFNTLGQEIAELHNGRLKSGEHNLTWNARDLPSGVYFLRLKSGDFSIVRKMMLMK